MIMRGAMATTTTAMSTGATNITQMITPPITIAVRTIIATTILMITRTRATATIIDVTEADSGSLLPLFVWLSPGFPVGAFAYSHGLEWAVEAGDIVDARSLKAWLVDLIEFGAPRSDAILFSVAYRAAAAADWPALFETNALAIALAPSAERRLETTAQGAAFVVAARAAWDCGPLRRLDRSPDERIAYAVAVAAAASGHSLPLEASLSVFVLAQAANLVSAAVRLGPIGQTDGQRIIAALFPQVRGLAREARCASLVDLGGAAFRSDIAAMRHESQYSRLFRS
jgi:urease accessory protein